jgi:hypothetical protein
VLWKFYGNASHTGRKSVRRTNGAKQIDTNGCLAQADESDEKNENHYGQDHMHDCENRTKSSGNCRSLLQRRESVSLQTLDAFPGLGAELYSHGAEQKQQAYLLKINMLQKYNISVTLNSTVVYPEMSPR